MPQVRNPRLVPAMSGTPSGDGTVYTAMLRACARNRGRATTVNINEQKRLDKIYRTITKDSNYTGWRAEQKINKMRDSLKKLVAFQKVLKEDFPLKEISPIHHSTDHRHTVKSGESRFIAFKQKNEGTSKRNIHLGELTPETSNSSLGSRKTKMEEVDNQDSVWGLSDLDQNRQTKNQRRGKTDREISLHNERMDNQCKTNGTENTPVGFETDERMLVIIAEENFLEFENRHNNNINQNVIDNSLQAHNGKTLTYCESTSQSQDSVILRHTSPKLLHLRARLNEGERNIQPKTFSRRSRPGKDEGCVNKIVFNKGDDITRQAIINTNTNTGKKHPTVSARTSTTHPVINSTNITSVKQPTYHTPRAQSMLDTTEESRMSGPLTETQREWHSRRLRRKDIATQRILTRGFDMRTLAWEVDRKLVLMDSERDARRTRRHLVSESRMETQRMVSNNERTFASKIMAPLTQTRKEPDVSIKLPPLDGSKDIIPVEADDQAGDGSGCDSAPANASVGDDVSPVVETVTMINPLLHKIPLF